MGRKTKINITAFLRAKTIAILSVGLLGFALPALAAYLPFNTNVNMNIGIGTSTPQGALVVMNGNVGIGTWVPGLLMDVSGTVRMKGFTLTGNGAGSGNVLVGNGIGVGTWMPASTLGAASGTNYWLLNGGAGNVGINTSYAVGIGTAFVGGTNEAALSVMNGNVGIGTWVPAGYLTVEDPAFITNELLINDGTTGSPNPIPGGYSPALVVNSSEAASSRPLWFGYKSGVNWDGFFTIGGCGSFTQLCLDLGSGATVNAALVSNGTNLAIGGVSNAAGFGGTSAETNINNIYFGNSGNVLIPNSNVGIGTFAVNAKLVVSGGNVGIGSLAPGQVLDVQGTARMTGFTLTGNGAANGNVLVGNAVGVGTWMPASTLATSAGSSYWLLNGGAGNVGINTSYAVGIGTSFVGGTGEASFAVMNGNVGIGTWIPSGILDVEGGAAPASTAGSSITIAAQDATGPANNNGGSINFYAGSGAGTFGPGYINFSNVTAVTESRNATDGYSPYGGPIGLSFTISNSFATNNNDSILNFTAVNSTPINQSAYIGAVSAPGATNYAPDLIFGQTIASSSYYERMRLDSSGNLGIGTIIPQGGLVVMNGNVGIGTWVPGLLMDVSGTVRMKGLTLTGNGAGSGNVLVANAVGIGTWMPASTLAISAGSNDWLLNGGAGNVGINTIYAVGIGTAFVGGTNEASFAVMNGNAGIGTWIPASSLDVEGGNIGIGTAYGITAGGNNLISMHTDSTSIYAGNQAGAIAAGGSLENVVMGYQALDAAVSTGNNEIAIGYQALYRNTSGSNNIAIGDQAASGASPISGSFNVALGYQALGNSSGSGGFNISLGGDTLYNNSGTNNTAVGDSALKNNGAGTNNTAVGNGAMTNGNAGTFNTAVGNTALANSAGSYSVAVGASAGQYINGGGSSLNTSTDSIFLGANTEAATNTDSNEIVIGYGAYGNGNNTVTLGNTGIAQTVLQGNVGIGTNASNGKLVVTGGNVGIGSLSPGQSLDVQGTVRTTGFTLTGNGAASGNVLVGNAVGVGTWMPASTLANAASGSNYWLLNGGAGNIGINTSYAVGIGTSFVGGMGEAALSVMNGNVGIGTWVPESPLHILKGISGQIPQAFSNLTVESNTSNYIHLLSTNASDQAVYFGDPNEQVEGGMVYNGLAGPRSLELRTENTSRLAISGNGNIGIGTFLTAGGLAVMNGNVGIGTWVPAQALDVIGNIMVDDSTGNRYLEVYNSSTGTISFQANSQDAVSINAINGYPNNTLLNINSNGQLLKDYLDINAGALFSIQSSGNVGIGTTIPQGGLVVMNGNVGLGTWVPGLQLDVNGTVRMKGLILTGNGAAAGNVLVTNAVGVGTWMPPSTLATVAGSNYWLNDTGNIGINTAFAVGIGTISQVNKLNILGNIGIGTFSYDPYMKSVAPNGGMIISGNVGIGTWLPGAPLDIETSTSNNLIQVSADGSAGYAFSVSPFPLGCGSSMASYGLYMQGTNFCNNESYIYSSAGLIFTVTPTANTAYVFNYGSSYSDTSSIDVAMGNDLPTFNPTSGTAVFDSFLTSPVINQTGGASGITRGVFVNSNITAAYDYRAIETDYGNVGIGTISGNLGIGSQWPGQRLDVNGTARMTGFTLSGNGAAAGNVMVSNGIGVGTWMPTMTLPVGTLIAGTANQVAYYTAPTTLASNSAMVFNAPNVGLGTVTPLATLQIVGNIGIGTVANGDKFITTSPPNGGMIVEGNIGIGSTAPGQMLDMQGTLRALGGIISGNVGIGTYKENAGLSVMNGNVGIGTWNPRATLDVEGALSTASFGGNVGIGTLVASNPLTVFGNAYALGSLLASPNGSTTAAPRLFGFSPAFSAGQAAQMQFGDVSNTMQNGYGERMQISAYWGIEIRGDSETTAPAFVTGTAADPSLTVFAPSTATSNTISLVNAAGTTTYDVFGSTGNVGIGTTITSSAMSVMSGNVGIGTWVPNNKLEVKGGNVGIGTYLGGAMVTLGGSCAAHQGTGVCFGASSTGVTCLGYCTAGAWPNCTTCTCC